MRTEAEVLTQVVEWAESRKDVRAAILTSSRVRPARRVDFLSDYDVELYVADLGPFRAGDDWLSVFGEIVVRWPLTPRATSFDGDGLTRLALFEDGVRIDFQITDRTKIDADAYDDGFRVLIDKDRLTANLDEPTFARYLIRRPTAEEYERVTKEFWWNAAYVPKCLWRRELPFAARMLSSPLRDEYLKTVIEWSIGLANDWSVGAGDRAKRMRHYLDEETWAAYTEVFPQGTVEDHWRAFFAAIELFRRLARQVGDALGYPYPAEIDRKMAAYFERIRATPRDGEAC